MAFDRQPFASTHPAINALFAAEFAQSQAQRQAEAQAMANETARAQIGAQTQLAQSQMRQAQVQQDYNNLFREREFQSRSAAEQARQKLYEDQLKIERDKIGPTRETLMKEVRAQQIIDANATAVNDARRANAMHQIELEKEIAAAKKGLYWSSSKAVYDDKKSAEYRALENKVHQNVRRALLAEKGGALNNIVADPNTFIFSPVQFDAEGKVIISPAPTAVTVPDPAALATSSATTPSGGLTQGEKIGAVTAIGGELVKKGLNSLADMFKIGGTTATPTTPTTTTTNAAPAAVVPTEPTTTGTNAPSVKTFYGSRIFLLTPEDDAILRNAMDGAPSEAAKTNVFQRFMRYLIESGRAVDTNERVGGIRVEIPASDGAASIPGLSNPSYLDSALGPRFGEPERYGAPFNP